MMKLKYLFDNRELATLIVSHWSHDPNSLELFNYYRISSNAIYPFKNDGAVQLLRFSPADEKPTDALSAELDFVTYLTDSDYNAPTYVPSLRGNRIEDLDTPWGRYRASVLTCVPGKSLDQQPYSLTIAAAHGRHLGALHSLSTAYHPPGPKRRTHNEVLEWITEELQNHTSEEPALLEVSALQHAFEKLATSLETYGLIHYDFELDNVFYHAPTDTLSAIDFDDAMYHWYIMDVDQALDSIENDVEAEGDDIPAVEELVAAFIAGYRENFNLTDDMLALRPLFRRFANLYGYTRILRACYEFLQDEPEWMMILRGKLGLSMKHRARSFGHPME